MAPFAIATLAFGGARSGWAQTTSSAPESEPANAPAPAPPWPRTITSGTKTLTVYEPQAERWDDNKLWATSAVVVKDTSAARSLYGVLRLTAHTDVDKTQQLVSLHDVEITRADFPGDPNQAGAYKKIIDDAGVLTSVLSMGRLQASLKTTEVARDPSRKVVENPTPKIIVSSAPSVLVLVDGQPKLRPLAGTTLSRVINTHALMLSDGRIYYLYVANGWLQSTTLEGAWAAATSPHPELDRAKEVVETSGLVERGEVDLLQHATQDAVGNVVVHVSATPAELIQTRGAPQVAPIHGTNLWYVTNTSQDVFLTHPKQQYYVVLSGRWYRAPSLNGPWQFVAANDLPPDFSRIPGDSPKANVLASIPGTTQAKEALIANQIPQAATVSRADGPTLDVDYDGPPKFTPIEETSLQYATNTSTPVLQVSPDSYFAVQDGVWFTSSSPSGPWAVATSVPSSIYTIPTSSPMHYVTYAYVDGASPGYVYDAYAPGYLGTVVAPSGVVVYGTGYDYVPWVGNYWYGGPWTFGFGAGLAFGAVGFGFAFASPFFVPFHSHGPHVVVATPAHFYAPVHTANVNVYNRWGGTGVVTRGGYVAPRAAYVTPRGGYVAPGGGYVTPRGGYVTPRGGYVAPGGAYAAPRGIGGGPPAGYVPPTDHRPNVAAPPVTNRPVAPAPVYRGAPVAPAPVYRGAPAAPAPVYRSAPAAPAPVYRSAPVAPAPAPHVAPAAPPAFHGGGGVPMHGGGGGMHR
jgi:hypothetical protein